ncbi:MAG: hypothetical protein M1416_02570 [Candidatus Pacearchaeota archaeon]|nr:hypothetical protein [Candidatus Pacearchaeota archaeon]
MMKKIFLIAICILFVNFIYAVPVNDSIHVNVQAVDTNGDIVTGDFKFEFNISIADDCNNPIYTNYSTQTTDAQGIISYYLENTNLNYSEQYWLCVYRTGILQSNEKIARVPYAFRARNITISGIEADSNLNIINYNMTTVGTGFFSWLGDLVTRITTLFVQDIDFNGKINGSGAINTTNNITADTFFGNWNSSKLFLKNTTKNIQELYNATASMIANLSISQSGVGGMNYANLAFTNQSNNFAGTWTNLSNVLNVTGSIFIEGDINISNWIANISRNWTAFANTYTDGRITAVNVTAQQGLTINTTANLGNLYNATASMIANLSISQLVSGGGDFSFTDFHSSFILNSSIINNTKNIQNLYNATASMIANLSITRGQNMTTLSCSNITGAVSNLCTITSSGGGVNYFDQQLNTTANVSFNNLTVSKNLTANTGFFSRLILGIIDISTWATNISLNYSQLTFTNWNTTWDNRWFFSMISTNVTLVNNSALHIGEQNRTKISCKNITQDDGTDADFCTDATGAGGDSKTNASTITCSGTDKISAYDNSTGIFTCTADETGSGSSSVPPWKISQEFLSYSTTLSYDPFLGAAISSGTGVAIAGNASHPGIIALRDSTTANGGFRVMTDVAAFRIAGNESARFIFQHATARTNVRYRMGFMDSITAAEPTDGCWIDVNTTAANTLKGMCKNNAGPTSTGSTYTIASNIWYIGEVVVNSEATSVAFSLYNYASGAQLWTSSVTSNIPTAGGRETGFGVLVSQNTTDAAANIMQMDYMELKINRTELTNLR